MFHSSPTPQDVYFRFLGFPIRVHPLFWILMLILGIMFHPHVPGGRLALWILDLVLWVAAAFVSILVHELGHALVFRHVYRVSSSITLHGMGGVTTPMYSYRRKGGYTGLFCEVFLSAAGALAGFLLAGLLILLLTLMSWSGMMGELLKIGFFLGALHPLSLLVVFMAKVIGISICWGIFNLLPIHPMDGGQIVGEIFSFISPRHGVGNSLVLSLAVAIILAVLAIQARHYYIAILFFMFALQNYRELTARPF